MTSTERRRAELRDKHADAQATVQGFLDKIEAKGRDEVNISDFEEVTKRSDELRAQITKLDDEEQSFRQSLEAGRKAVQSFEPDYGEDDKGAVRSTDHENLDDLRNSHPAFRTWDTAGDFLQSVHRHEVRGGDDRMGKYLETRAPTGMGNLIDSDGGALVPPQWSSELMQKTYSVGSIASRCRKFSMTSNTLKIPAINETSRADGSRYGGIRGYWGKEASAPTATKAEVKTINLEINKLHAAVWASDEILDDANFLTNWISTIVPQELKFKLEDAIVNGDGAGKPKGIIGSGCIVSVAKESSQTATTVVKENLAKMRSRLYAGSRANSVWLINQDVEQQLLLLQAGTDGAMLMLPNGFRDLPYDTLLGRPVLPVEYMATLGTVADIVLADLSTYILAQRGQVKSATSMHVKFLEGEQVFKFTMRVDGAPWWAAPLTPKAGSTLSPFVSLATRS